MSPNQFHYAHIGEWAKAFPEAIAWASPRVRERARARRIDVDFTRDLENLPDCCSIKSTARHLAPVKRIPKYPIIAYTPVSIQRSIAAGVKCIEHGHLNEQTAMRMAEKGIWLSTQLLDEGGEGGAAQLGPAEQAKMKQVIDGTDTVYGLAKKYHLKTAFGTDILFSAREAEQQGSRLASLTRWYTPAEALIMATSTNAELLSISGLRNPYPGKLGVVEEGALADLVLVDGNPLENLDLVAEPATNFNLIMKDGKIYKNAVN